MTQGSLFPGSVVNIKFLLHILRFFANFWKKSQHLPTFLLIFLNETWRTFSVFSLVFATMSQKILKRVVLFTVLSKPLMSFFPKSCNQENRKENELNNELIKCSRSSARGAVAIPIMPNKFFPIQKTCGQRCNYYRILVLECFMEKQENSSCSEK